MKMKMRLSLSDIKGLTNFIKENVSITDVLSYFGVPYKVQYGRVIFSLRPERNPSCSAVLKGNIWAWRDFGDDNLRGSVIDLYNFLKYGNCAFSIEAVKGEYY